LHYRNTTQNANSVSLESILTVVRKWDIIARLKERINGATRKRRERARKDVCAAALFLVTLFFLTQNVANCASNVECSSG